MTTINYSGKINGVNFWYDVTGTDITVGIMSAKAGVTVKEHLGKKKQPFGHVVDFSAGNHYATPATSTQRFEEASYIVYQTRLIPGGKVYTAVILSAAYAGDFSEIKYCKDIDKLNAYWKRLTAGNKREEASVQKVESESELMNKKLEELSIIFYNYVTDDEMHEFLPKLYEAAMLVTDDNERVTHNNNPRRGLFMLHKSWESKGKGLYNLRITSNDTDLSMRLRKPEVCDTIYQYIVILAKSFDPDFTEPTEEEVFGGRDIKADYEIAFMASEACEKSEASQKPVAEPEIDLKKIIVDIATGRQSKDSLETLDKNLKVMVTKASRKLGDILKNCKCDNTRKWLLTGEFMDMNLEFWNSVGELIMATK